MALNTVYESPKKSEEKGKELGFKNPKSVPSNMAHFTVRHGTQLAVDPTWLAMPC